MIPGWCCFSYCSKIFLFGPLTNKDFVSSTSISLSQATNSDNDEESLLSLKPPSHLALLYNQLNNTSPENNNDLENIVNSKYYGIEQIQNLEFPDKQKSLSLFHINALFHINTHAPLFHINTHAPFEKLININ